MSLSRLPSPYENTPFPTGRTDTGKGTEHFYISIRPRQTAIVRNVLELLGKRSAQIGKFFSAD